MNDQTHKEKIYTIIFGTTTPAGKYFDITLIACILISMLVLMLDSVQALASEYHYFLRIAEWFFTILFTLEYMLRIYCSPKPWRYVTSFYGFIDLISVLPSYLSLFFSGANYLLMIRLFRVLRVFRVFKLFRYLSEANVLIRSWVWRDAKSWCSLYRCWSCPRCLARLCILLKVARTVLAVFPKVSIGQS